MNPLENRRKSAAESASENQSLGAKVDQNEVALAASQESDVLTGAEIENSDAFSDAPTLYNDVVIDASQLDQDEGLDFKVEEISLSSDKAMPFSVNEESDASLMGEDFSAVPAMHADQKILETRQEPVMLDEKAAEAVASFAAVDSEEDSAVSDDEAAMVANEAEEASKKQRKGSVLGMG